MVVTCCYKGCTTRYGPGSGISFFRFPVQNSQRCLEWILRSGNDDFLDLPDAKVSLKRLCSLHFEKRDFNINSRGVKLMERAVPKWEVPEESRGPQDILFIRTDAIDNPQLSPASSPDEDPLMEQDISTSAAEEIDRLKKQLNYITEKYETEKRKLTNQLETISKKKKKNP